ncbi:alpha-galactosidase [Lacticaseibacillus paracasei]|nr:alpha-galactosidase [Lacticaseibacillus paracasei]
MSLHSCSSPLNRASSRSFLKAFYSIETSSIRTLGVIGSATTPKAAYAPVSNRASSRSMLLDCARSQRYNPSP